MAYLYETGIKRKIEDIQTGQLYDITDWREGMLINYCNSLEMTTRRGKVLGSLDVTDEGITVYPNVGVIVETGRTRQRFLAVEGEVFESTKEITLREHNQEIRVRKVADASRRMHPRNHP